MFIDRDTLNTMAGKRYLLFIYNRYSPCGGWEDFAGAFDTIEAAVASAEQQTSEFETPEYLEKNDRDRWHIVDSYVLEVIHTRPGW